MSIPLISKLECFAELSKSEREALLALCKEQRRVEAGTDILAEGANPDTVLLILEGFACRYKMSEDGRRQIVAFMVPGDLCNLHVCILKKMDHSVGALTAVSLVEIPRDKILELLDAHPRLTRALWWSTLVDEATLREWIFSLATRTAYERAAHLFCELCTRLQMAGLSSGNQCNIVMRQEDISDAVGLTRAHLSGSLRKLQEEGMIELRRGCVRVLDLVKLARAGHFKPDYLHVQNR